MGPQTVQGVAGVEQRTRTPLLAPRTRMAKRPELELGTHPTWWVRGVALRRRVPGGPYNAREPGVRHDP